MSSLRNALEDIVIREAQKQLAPLKSAIGTSIRLADVVAYTLNRLPPLYATSHHGWQLQRRRLVKEMRSQIIEAVSVAIAAFSTKNFPASKTPLPEIELKSQARALVSLRRVLKQPELRWSDVPAALEKALGNSQNLNRHSSASNSNSEVTRAIADLDVYPEPVKSDQTVIREDTHIQDTQDDHYDLDDRDSLSASMRSQIDQLRACLGTTKDGQVKYAQTQNFEPAPERRNPVKVVKSANGQEISVKAMEAQQLEIYTLPAKLEFSNVLEKLVLLVAGHLVRNFDPEIRAQINLTEVMAYALNRLPPMYAASDRDYRRQRQYAQSELANRVTDLVKRGIELVLASPRNVQPLPFEKFNQEYELALPQIKQLLKCRNITLSNLATLAADIIKFKRQSAATQTEQERSSQAQQVNVVSSPPQSRVVGGYYQPAASMY
ncbi:Late competence development protein ComFB [Thalassoporum mexicanum PCC 7367]|uniref:late competence development ComFB family protein n=1 Tax=Thalassoporum mexicanum TaxID=3457544 RepID=UPI00029FA238|nr:late competence development ComFB family protein [Pseudanabaena sp. PCC 7367]AFY71771.1 Late competence development protein ComFB [Pseudanabaena sp. PCC 7367]